MKQEINLSHLKTVTEEQVQFLSTKATLSETDIYISVKDFFKQLFDLQYEFSHEELIEEIDKTYIEEATKNTILDFVRMIGRIEYDSEVKYSEAELKGMLTAFNDVVEQLISVGLQQQKKGFLFTKPKEDTLSELLEKINHESNPEKAKETYKKALEKYSAMTEKEQEIYYQRLLESFAHLKNKF